MIRWWVVDLADSSTPGGRLIAADDAEQAVAAFRAELAGATVTCGHDPAREAATAAIAVTGPLTAEGAFAHDVGWTWAWEMCEPGVPLGPASRDVAVRVLGAELAGEIERHLAGVYGVPLRARS
jgi:hypothetical protein